MSSDGSDASRVKENGWRQGSVLRESTANQLELKSSGGRARFVVISHDCDITNSDFENEPFVELLEAEIIEPSEKKGFYEWGKNPRILDFTQPTETWRFRISRRHFVLRQSLCNASPADIELDRDQVRSLANWVARRYIRAAFPDEFNKRVRGVLGSVRKQLKNQGDHLTAIFLQVTDEELDKSAPYEISICGTMRHEDYEDRNRRNAAQALLNAMEAAFEKLGDGITVELCELKSEAEVTLDDRRMLKRWDFDDLTIRGDGIDELPPRD